MPKIDRYRVYPRGFIGVEDSPQQMRSPKPFSELMSHHQYHVGREIRSGDNISGHSTIESLYTSYIRNDPRSTAMSFRTDIYKAAIEVFGGHNKGRMYDWFKRQYANKTTGDSHSRFMEDTIKFIKEGRRNLSVETWAALIAITDEADTVGPIPDSISEFFKYDESLTVSDFIVAWCSQPTGTEDLLGTLHVLFGNL
jgi:hypothetical protein